MHFSSYKLKLTLLTIVNNLNILVESNNMRKQIHNVCKPVSSLVHTRSLSALFSQLLGTTNSVQNGVFSHP